MADQYSPAYQANPPDTTNKIDVAQLFKNRIDFENALMTQNQNRIAQWMQQGQMNALAPQYQGQPQQQAQAVGAQQAQLGTQQQEQKALKTAAETLKSLKTAIGLKGVKENWDTLKNINPLFSKMDAQNLTDDGYIVNDPKTGEEYGRWIENPEGGAPKFVKTGAKEPTNPFLTLKASMPKQEGETDAAWNKRIYDQYQKDQEILQSKRIPALAPSSDLPPGYTVDRRKGGVIDPNGKKVPPEKIAELFGEKAEMKANAKAEGILKPRIELIKTFTKRIDANVNLFNNFKSKFKTDWPRIANLTLKQAYAGAIGSGELASLRQILFSIESEVAKVERGSIGVAGADVESAKIQAKIHDLNLPISELQKVLEASKALGKTAEKVLNDQWNELKAETKGQKPAAEQKEDPLGIR
jgi:hypothetical protein